MSTSDYQDSTVELPMDPESEIHDSEAVKAEQANASQASPLELRPAVATPMYGPFFGLTEPPFDLTPDPKFLFLTPRLREALSNLRYGLATSKGLTVLLGDAGTGKTTLVRAALAELGQASSRYVLVSNPTLGRAEFFEFLAKEFGFSSEAAKSKTTFLFELEKDVKERFAQGGLTGLIVDEAQSMPHELLEEIRLLGNIETTTSKLLNIVLSGQPELAERLNEPSLRQLKQRVALRCELKALTLDEAAAYISGRVRIAGGDPGQVFTVKAVRLIHEASAGIPRSINVLCDNALVSGFASQIKPISVELVADVCRDFDLQAVPRDDSYTIAPPAPVKPVAPVVPASPVKATTAPKPVTPKPRPTGTSNEREMFRSVNPKKRSRFSFFS